MRWQKQLEDILDFSIHSISDIEPADWAQQRIHVSSGNFIGPLSYDITPFSVEIINCLSPYYPAERVVVKGGAQWGKTVSIIQPAIAFYISEHPCEILYLTGHSELSEEAMKKVEGAIEGAGLLPLIGAQTQKKKNARSGDTLKVKEFPNGTLTSGSSTNHKLLMQRTAKFIIGDDIDAAKGSSTEDGSTIALIEGRAKSFGTKKKILYISTPRLAQTSMIQRLYLRGDQRKYLIPCQCCGTAIELIWDNFLKELDDHNEVVPGSVRYKCQICSDEFDDSNKYEFNKAGYWQPTAVAKDPGTVSFYLPTWYAAPSMDSWEHIMKRYIAANPPGQPTDKALMKTWTNLDAGEVFEDDFEELKANVLQENTRDYEPGIIPEALSVKDGNGRIVLVTCGADMNGILENGRLDYEIVAWAENGASYSVIHGSIGTFVPAILKRKEEKEADDTPDWWTYEENKPLSIWTAFERILNTKFTVDVRDTTPRWMTVSMTTLDVGHLKQHAMVFIKKMQNRGLFVQGVKGKGNADYYYTDKDARVIKRSAEDPDNLWSVEVGHLKDNLAVRMNLKWVPGEESQPTGFMNYPNPGNGLYGWKNYFQHFESEKRVYVKNRDGTDVKARWEKKASDSQNHMWDCFIYNMAGKDIFIKILVEQYGKKGITVDWNKYAEMQVKMPVYKIIS